MRIALYLCPRAPHTLCALYGVFVIGIYRGPTAWVFTVLRPPPILPAVHRATAVGKVKLACERLIKATESHKSVYAPRVRLYYILFV